MVMGSMREMRKQHSTWNLKLRQRLLKNKQLVLYNNSVYEYFPEIYRKLAGNYTGVVTTMFFKVFFYLPWMPLC